MIYLIIGSHSFAQTMHGRLRSNLSKSPDGSDDQISISRIEEISQRVDCLRITYHTKGFNYQTYFSPIL